MKNRFIILSLSSQLPSIIISNESFRAQRQPFPQLVKSTAGKIKFKIKMTSSSSLLLQLARRATRSNGIAATSHRQQLVNCLSSSPPFSNAAFNPYSSSVAINNVKHHLLSTQPDYNTYESWHETNYENHDSNARTSQSHHNNNSRNNGSGIAEFAMNPQPPNLNSLDNDGRNIEVPRTSVLMELSDRVGALHDVLKFL